MRFGFSTNGDMVTVERFDPKGTGNRILDYFRADQLETESERGARLGPKKPKPPRAAPYDV